MKNEWVRTLRTAAQALLALIPVAPVLVNALGLGETSAIGGGVIAAAAGAARLMAIPQVDALVDRFLKVPGK